MGPVQLVTIYCLKYVLICFFIIMFMVLQVPRILKLIFRKKVTYEEPNCVKNPRFGEHSHVDLKSDNIKIHYVSNGEKGKPLMLFLHGSPEFWYSWRYQLPEFGKDHFAVAIVMVGYGKSSKPKEIEKSYIKEFINELGYDDCILVGHDWGSIIAFQVTGGKCNLIFSKQIS